MRTRHLAILGGLLLLVALPGMASAQENGDTEASTTLLVVSGTSGSVDGSTLTLEGVPAVIWFSDRPARDAGHVSVEAFVEAWASGDDSFAADPPDAELSILDAELDGSVLELLSVSGDASSLTFEFAALEGTPPEGAFGPAALFIDACDPAYPGCPPY